MVALNLLPDLRQAKIRDLHRRQLAFGLGALVVIVSGGSVLALFLILGGIKLQINNLNNQIATRQSQLKSVADLPQALTAQSHVSALPTLFAKRSSYSHFLAILQAVTPGEVRLENVAQDVDGTTKIVGKSKSYFFVSKYARAIEASPELAPPTLQPNHPGLPSFSSVVITNVSESGNLVSFVITASSTPSLTTGTNHVQN